MLFPTAGCDSSLPGTLSTSGAAVKNSAVISYGGASSRLAELAPEEANDQLRDWARLGLASYLKLDTGQLRDNLYDSLPVRDAGFADLARQLTGPGRTLFDGDTLHVLVPRNDPHRARTIGLSLDQHRTDAGSDPKRVQIHPYQFHRDTQTIELQVEPPRPAGEVRTANGYVTARIDQNGGLREFLARTRQLSTVEIRGAEIRAGGWNWPDVPSVPVDDEDIAVLQREYLRTSGPPPGFSLDQVHPPTIDDVHDLLPELAPRWVDVLAGYLADPARRPPDELVGKVENALILGKPEPSELAAEGLPSDRAHLWALRAALERRPMYSQARYDGDLKGTKVGMTLFYTDHIAKNWVSGVGNGVPLEARGGFVADPKAKIPLSECFAADEVTGESGRLWFGQNDSDFDFTDDRVNIGSRATRLFTRSNAEGDSEVEPSYQFGRALNWWDRHYQVIADYEPQYQRLEQIMRWSGALEWLDSRQAKLPKLDTKIRSDLRFQDWYQQNRRDLRESSQIEFVAPRSAGREEALLHRPSPGYQTCGYTQISGGVGLGDLISRRGDNGYRLDVTGPARRAGLYDASSALDPATGSGELHQITLQQVRVPGTNKVEIKPVGSLRYTIGPESNGVVGVATVGVGRKVAPLGGVKIWRVETATRELTNEISGGDGRVSQNIRVQRQELGRLDVGRAADTIMIRYRWGPLDRILRALGSIQRRPVSGKVPDAVDGVLYRVDDAAGQAFYKVDGPDGPWLTISEEVRPPGEELTFRLGAPDASAKRPRFFQARLARGPPRGPTGSITITPGAADRPAHVVQASPAARGAMSVKLTTREGSTSVYLKSDGQPLVLAEDPVFGLNGTVLGAAVLQHWPAILEARRAARDVDEGTLRAVRLGEEGVALVRDAEIQLYASGDQVADRALVAIAADPSRMPPVRLDGDRLLHVGSAEVTVDPAARAAAMTLGDVFDTGEPAFGEDSVRSTMSFVNGVPVPNSIRRNLRVLVRDATVGGVPNRVSLPDIITCRGQQWRPLDGGYWNNGGGGGSGNGGGGSGRPGDPGNGSGRPSSTSATPSATAGPAPVSGGQAAGGRILLVCLADEHVSACVQ
jgi:hypothetical protein